MTKHILIRPDLSPFAEHRKLVQYRKRFPGKAILLYRDQAAWLARKEQAA